jgi:hypothetical protein
MPKLPTCSAVRVPKSFAALKNQPFANWNRRPAFPWKCLNPNSHGMASKQAINLNLLRIRRSVWTFNDRYCFRKTTDRKEHNANGSSRHCCCNTSSTAATSSGPRPSVHRPLPNSKFVCGVKGNHRELRELSVIEGYTFYREFSYYWIDLSVSVRLICLKKV